MPSKKCGVAEHSISSSILLLARSRLSIQGLYYWNSRVWRCHLYPLERPAVGMLFGEGKPRPWLQLFGWHRVCKYKLERGNGILNCGAVLWRGWLLENKMCGKSFWGALASGGVSGKDSSSCCCVPNATLLPIHWAAGLVLPLFRSVTSFCCTFSVLYSCQESSILPFLRRCWAVSARCSAEDTGCRALQSVGGQHSYCFCVALAFFLTGGTVVSLVAFDTSSLAWLKATGTALGLVCLTLLTSSEPKLSVRLL